MSRRLSVSVDPALADELQRAARRAGRSQSALVREGIRLICHQGAAPSESSGRGFEALIGVFEPGTGPSDVALEHDRYLEEAEVAGWRAVR